MLTVREPVCCHTSQQLKNNKFGIEVIVHLSEACRNPAGVLYGPGMKFWKDGQEIPVSAVTEDMLKPEDVAFLDKDGTMHSYNVFYRNAFYDILLQAVAEHYTWWGEV